MSLQNDYSQWLKRGRQRAAVVQVLRKPMTSTEICAAARTINPRIQLRDIWFLMKQFADQGLIVCLTPEQVTGRLHYFTNKGRVAVLSTLGISFEPIPEEIDWRKYSTVVRGRIRQITLSGLGRLEGKTGQPQTAAEIRKQIRNDHAVSLDQVIRSLKELLREGLVQYAGVTKKQCRRLHRLTPAGRRILEQLKR